MLKIINNKRGVFSIAISTGLIIAATVLLIVAFGGLFVILNLLKSISIPIAGLFLWVALGVGIITGKIRDKNIIKIAAMVGLILILIPLVVPGMQGVTLASVLF